MILPPPCSTDGMMCSGCPLLVLHQTTYWIYIRKFSFCHFIDFGQHLNISHSQFKLFLQVIRELHYFTFKIGPKHIWGFNKPALNLNFCCLLLVSACECIGVVEATKGKSHKGINNARILTVSSTWAVDLCRESLVTWDFVAVPVINDPLTWPASLG